VVGAWIKPGKKTGPAKESYSAKAKMAEETRYMENTLLIAWTREF